MNVVRFKLKVDSIDKYFEVIAKVSFIKKLKLS